MLLAKLMGVRNFQVFDVEEPKIQNNEEALIKVCGTGVCGSDMHPWLGESIRATYDRVPGHEFCGIIEEIRSANSALKPGDKVMINPAVSCGECEACRAGQGYNCEHCEVIGGERPGAFAEKIVVPVSTLYKLPDEMDMTLAALIEPVAFAEHCTHGLLGNVVVIGLGAIGLSCAMLLRYHGCNVIGLDINDNQLKVAKELCCNHVINSKTEDPVARIEEILGGKYKVDYVVDAVFNEWSLNFNLDVIKKGGTMIEIGVPIMLPKINSIRMLCREVHMETRYLYSQVDFIRAMEYVTENRVDFSPFVSKVFPLAQIQEAFEYKADTPSLKVVLQANPDLI